MINRASWVLAGVLSIALAGCGNSSVASNPNSAPAASAPATPPPTPPAPAKPSDTGEILTVLSVEHQVDVPTQTDGVVADIIKDEGSRVQAGEVLARLDDRSIVAELEKAQADLRIAKNNVSYQEAELKAKEAAYRRQQQMRQYGLSSEADLEHAEFEATGATYDLASWKANVEKNQAEIRRLETELDKTRIRAPFGGLVARRYIRLGQGVSKSDKCFRVSQLSPLRVQFQVPETSARQPHLGDTVGVMVPGDSSRSFSARIMQVSPTVDPSSDSYEVTAQLTGAGLADLRPGMAVRVDWPGTSHSKP
ncbi:MAG: efflux RND transporter periplasmic adaptor subunit [Candidatus Acidiferrales bacterium]